MAKFDAILWKIREQDSSWWWGGTPWGSDTQVQFNDWWVFAWDAWMTYSKSTDALTVWSVITAEIKSANSAWTTIKNSWWTPVADFWTWWSTNASIHWAININTDSADYRTLTWWTWTITETATWSSTNISINLVPKWTGRVKDNGTNLTKESTNITVNWTTQDLSTDRTFTVTDANLSTSDITANNSTTSKHWFLPKLSWNASQFLNGQGNYATPSGTTNSYTTSTFTAQTSVNIIHNFWTYPVVDILNNSWAVIIPLSITHNTTNDFTVTFSSSTTWTIIASVGSPQPNAFITVNSNYTILTSDNTINCSTWTFTLTLPTAVWSTWRIYRIKNSGTGIITINTTSSQTVDWLASWAITLEQYSALSLQSDWSNWIILASL